RRRWLASQSAGSRRDAAQRMRTALDSLVTNSADARRDTIVDKATRVLALNQAAMHFQSQCTNRPFWATADVETPPDHFSAAFRWEMANFDDTWGIGRTQMPPHSEAKEECQSKQDQAPGRKFTGILSYPGLSKYFRLIVDANIDRRDIEHLFAVGSDGKRR